MASKAAAAGFDRIAVLAGGLHLVLPSIQQPPPAASVPALHHNALGLLLGLTPLPWEVLQICRSSLAMSQLLAAAAPHSNAVTSRQSDNSAGNPDQPTGEAAAAGAAGGGSGSEGVRSEPRLLLLDVRRHDERTFYGAIPGSHHLPVDELASALQLPGPLFRRRYHFDLPRPTDIVVLQSRLESRATWAAQLVADAGWNRLFVSAGGVCAWRFGLAVQPYPSYQQVRLVDASRQMHVYDQC
eukprot:gene12308-12444_t